MQERGAVAHLTLRVGQSTPCGRNKLRLLSDRRFAFENIAVDTLGANFVIEPAQRSTSASSMAHHFGARQLTSCNRMLASWALPRS